MAATVKVFACVIRDCSYHFRIAVWRAKEAESTHMNPRNAIVAILAALSLSLALADDFKTINGKEYKNVTVSRVEADGIVIKTKTGLSKSISLNFLKTFRNGFITVLRRHLERQARKSSTVKVLPISLRNESKKGSTTGKRSYKGNTRPVRQS